MSDISSEPGGRSIGVTIKYGKGYEAPWITFRGLASEVRADLTEVFGMDPEVAEKLTIDELTLNAAHQAQAKRTVSQKLDAVAIPASSSPADSTGSAAGGADEAQAVDPWASGGAATAAPASTPEAPVDPNAPIRAKIAGVTSIEGLKGIWADHQTALNADADLLATWKARGRELKAAA